MRVLANRFEQAIARAAVCFVGEHERTPDQRAEVLDHVELVDVVVPDDRLGVVEGGATGEDRQTIEHESLVVAEEVIRPVDRAPQRLVAFHRTAGTAAQQPELVVEPRRDLLPGVIACTRAAASSIARGMPSRRRQIWTTAAALSSCNTNPRARRRRVPRTDAPRRRPRPHRCSRRDRGRRGSECQDAFTGERRDPHGSWPTR